MAKFDVFISYAKDQATAFKICNLLETQGYNCWIAPRNIDPTEFYEPEIAKGIRDSRYFLVLINEHINNSIDTQNEVSIAAEEKKKIIPFRLKDIKLNDRLNYHLRSIQWIDATTDFNSAISKVIQVIENNNISNIDRQNSISCLGKTDNGYLFYYHGDLYIFKLDDLKNPILDKLKSLLLDRKNYIGNFDFKDFMENYGKDIIGIEREFSYITEKDFQIIGEIHNNYNRAIGNLHFEICNQIKFLSRKADSGIYLLRYQDGAINQDYYYEVYKDWIPNAIILGNKNFKNEPIKKKFLVKDPLIKKALVLGGMSIKNLIRGISPFEISLENKNGLLPWEESKNKIIKPWESDGGNGITKIFRLKPGKNIFTLRIGNVHKDFDIDWILRNYPALGRGNKVKIGVRIPFGSPLLDICLLQDNKEEGESIHIDWYEL